LFQEVVKVFVKNLLPADVTKRFVGARQCTLGTWPALACAWLLAAAGASTAEMNVVALDLEFSRVDLGPRDAVKARILDVNDAPAIQTDKMVVLAELGVEAGRRTRVASLGHQAEGNEDPQDAVDRHAGDLGQLAADGAVELLGSRVVGAVQDRLEDGAALRSDRQAAFPMGGEEAVDSLFLVCRAHGL
jgi:hypothetical protein